MVEVVRLALLHIRTPQDNEPIHGPFLGTKVYNMLTQALVEVALAILVQCIPHKSPLENQSIFQEAYVNREFVFNMDSIDLNITIWHSATIKLSQFDCQTIISIFGIHSLSQL